MFKKLKIKSVWIAAIAAGLAMAACSGGHDGYSRKNGVLYKLIVIGDTVCPPNAGDYVTCQLRYSTMSDSTFFVGDRTFQLTEPEFDGSIDVCFLMMSAGDSASFIIDAENFFLKTLQCQMPSFINKGDKMKIDIRMDDIRTEEQYRRDKEEFLKWIEDFGEYEKLVLHNFIEKEKIEVEPTESGMYFISLVNGSGKPVEYGDIVTVNYEGRFLNGRFFDSTVKRNQPFEFVYGTELQVIPGLEDAIGRMREGQRALVILPSGLAWGEKGSSTGIVPPFTTVIYEVELLKAVPQSSDSEDSEDIEKQSDSTEE